MDAEWENSNDFFFTNLFEFDSKKTRIIARSALIASEKKCVKSLEPNIKGYNIRSGNQEENQPFDNNHNYTKSALILIPYSIDFLSKQSICNHTKQVLYPGEIAHSFRTISKTKTTVMKTGYSSPANFDNSCTAKLYEHIAQVLQILGLNIDNQGADEPASLKKSIAQYNWLE